MIALFAWRVDTDRAATVTTLPGLDSRALTPFGKHLLTDRALQLTKVTSATVGSKSLLDLVYGGSDIPLILSARARRALSQYLEHKGTFVRASIAETSEDYFLFTPTDVVDVVDVGRSCVKETRYLRILTSPVLCAARAVGHDVFVARGFETQHVWVSDRFVATAIREGITGARFLPVEVC